jgi:hypothetical protein
LGDPFSLGELKAGKAMGHRGRVYTRQGMLAKLTANHWTQRRTIFDYARLVNNSLAATTGLFRASFLRTSVS